MSEPRRLDIDAVLSIIKSMSPELLNMMQKLHNNKTAQAIREHAETQKFIDSMARITIAIDEELFRRSSTTYEFKPDDCDPKPEVPDE